MTKRIAVSLLTVASFLGADTLVMRDGRRIDGSYVGGDNHSVRFASRNRVDTFQLQDIEAVQFNNSQAAYAPSSGYPQSQGYPPQQSPAQSNYPSQPNYPAQSNYPINANGPQADYPQSSNYPAQNAGNSTYSSQPNTPQFSAPPTGALEVPAGTEIVVRLIDPVNSDQDRLGQTFRASVDQPVVVNGQTAIPRGADVIASLIDAQKSGKIEGRTVLTLDLKSVTVNNHTYGIVTTGVPEQSGSRGERSAKVIGGTAALGAIIGAIAGGGRGAAIGAGSGAAVGTAAEVATSGQKVKVPAETRLTFTLQNPLDL